MQPNVTKQSLEMSPDKQKVAPQSEPLSLAHVRQPLQGLTRWSSLSHLSARLMDNASYISRHPVFVFLNN